MARRSAIRAGRSSYLATFGRELAEDRLAAKRVDIAVLTFDKVETACELGAVETFQRRCASRW
jgi:uncharacterized protein YegL